MHPEPSPNHHHNRNPFASIRSYKDLQAEQNRLKRMIDEQRQLLQHDFIEFRNQLRKDARPAIKVINFVKNFVRPETRNGTLLSLGTSLTLNFVLRKLFLKSNFLVRMIVPSMLKNFSTHIIHRFASRFL